jgi:hypothetical protein
MGNQKKNEENEILQSGDNAPEIVTPTATEAKSVSGKTVFLKPGEVLVVEKETGVPFVCSQRFWDNVYSKHPEKFELKKT